MLRFFKDVHPLVLLVIATILEVSGDAVVRMAIYNHGWVRFVSALFLRAQHCSSVWIVSKPCTYRVRPCRRALPRDTICGLAGD